MNICIYIYMYTPWLNNRLPTSSPLYELFLPFPLSFLTLDSPSLFPSLGS